MAVLSVLDPVPEAEKTVQNVEGVVESTDESTDENEDELSGEHGAELLAVAMEWVPDGAAMGDLYL
jgi:hypothetical protein